MAAHDQSNGDSKLANGETTYFATNPRPASLDEHISSLAPFIADHVRKHNRVALVTSGGTTVPLENQTVRFIDNFSAGTRGATSAEYFLENGYAVIFLHRQFSLLPYSRHFSHSTNCFLDYMTTSSTGEVVIDGEYQAQMASVLQKYERAKREKMLLLLPFTSVNEYLWHLREIAMLMRPLSANGLFYLAAAVSDFFIPAERMVEHKIQSSEDFAHANHGTTSSTAQEERSPAAHMDGAKLVIDLDPVPKFLKQLVDVWSPKSMIVSFKLETDPSILAEKSRYALKKYSHDLVIGNMLNTRKHEVLFVSAAGGDQWIRVPGSRRSKSETTATMGEGRQATEMPLEIESLIVPEVARLHSKIISNGRSR
ncbi:Phosphopantothenate--cysteine ligase cab2 [Oleoguttula sp. CCFEE 5521]